MAPPVKELQRPPAQRTPTDPPRPAAQVGPDGAQLQVRISELDPATNISDADLMELSQGGISRRWSIQQLKATSAQDLSQFLTGIVPGDGIQVLGGAPVPTVQLDDVGAPGTFGDAGHVPEITVDPYGRVVSVALIPVAVPDVSGFAPLASPTFTGDPKAPTPAPGDADTSIATTAFVKNAIDTRGFAPINDPAFTGNPTAPTPAPGDNDTSVATTAFVEARVAAMVPVDLTPYALKESPVFTGDPRAPTQPAIDNDTSIATTAFVKSQNYAPLADPAFTGNPTAPTPAVDDNDTSIATTEFVTRALAAIGSGGDASISVGTTPPADPQPNQLWFNNDSRVGQMFIYYDDGDSAQWVPTSPSVSSSSPGGDFCAVGVSPLNRNVWTVLYNLTVISGNSGGWYVPATGQYKPPPGRYYIFATYSGSGDAASNQMLTVRKNGVNLTTSQDTSANGTWYSTPVTAVVVDANGYDSFDVAGYASAGSQGMVGMSMVAFPLSGIKGPPGDIGAPAASFNVRATQNDTMTGTQTLTLFRSGYALPVKDYDPDAVWDLTNARFTAPSNGRYAFQCAAFLQPTAASFMAMHIRHMTAANATIRDYCTGNQADQNNYGTGFNLSIELQMVAGEKVGFFMSSNTAAASCVAYATLGAGISAGMAATYASGRKVV